MSDQDKKPLSFIEKMKLKALQQVSYGGEAKPENAKVEQTDCPNCGAGRAKQDGITHCAYCGFEFIRVKLENGIHIKKEDNSNDRT